MDVNRPDKLARALGPGPALVLAATGLVMGAFYFFITRPQAIRFSQQGRKVVGHVIVSSGSKYGHAWGRSDKSYCTIGANDPETGWQVVQAYGPRPKGQSVALLCLTPARSCMTEEQVAGDIVMWPPNSSLICAFTCLALAGALQLASARKTRSRQTSER